MRTSTNKTCLMLRSFSARPDNFVHGRNRTLFLVPAAVLILAGCAHVPSDLGLAEVQATAQARTASELSWSSAEEAEPAVHALLEAPLTANSAAQIALIRSPEAALAFAELGISRADLVEAGTLPNPSLGAMARFPIDGGSGTMLDLDGGFPLISAIMLPLRRSIEEQNFARAKLIAADRALAIVSSARVSWYEAVAAQLERSILADAQEAATAAADLAHAQYNAGNLSRLERLGHESAAVQARLDARAAATGAVTAEEALRRTLGLHPGDPDWLLMPALPPATPINLDAAVLVKAALQNRLDLAAANHNVEAVTRAFKLTRRFRFTPMIDVGVSAEREFDGEWSLGPSLDFELPIFDRKRGAVMRLQSLVALAMAERDAIEADISAEIRTLVARLVEAAEGAIAYQDELLPLHRDLVAETQLHYNGMLLGVYDLLNAKRNELESQRGAVRAQRDYWSLRVELERVIAGPLPGAEATAAESQPAAEPSAKQPEATHDKHKHTEE